MMMKIHGAAFGLCLFDAVMFAVTGNALGAAGFLALAAATVFTARYGYIPVRT